MTSRRYRWQTRWHLDYGAVSAVHESGLVVRFSTGPPVLVQPVNADTIELALQAKHGPHNAPLMVARLLREARELLERSGMDA